VAGKQIPPLQQAVLDKIFQAPARLRIMTALMVKRELDFTQLVETLELTRGNLSVHMKLLLEHALVSVSKDFVHNKPKTTYTITCAGEREFERYVGMLELMVKDIRTQVGGH
jgi:DNA-binding transcriptional ArsR family regulator